MIFKSIPIVLPLIVTSIDVRELAQTLLQTALVEVTEHLHLFLVAIDIGLVLLNVILILLDALTRSVHMKASGLLGVILLVRLVDTSDVILDLSPTLGLLIVTNRLMLVLVLLRESLPPLWSLWLLLWPAVQTGSLMKLVGLLLRLWILLEENLLPGCPLGPQLPRLMYQNEEAQPSRPSPSPPSPFRRLSLPNL